MEPVCSPAGPPADLLQTAGKSAGKMNEKIFLPLYALFYSLSPGIFDTKPYIYAKYTYIIYIYAVVSALPCCRFSLNYSENKGFVPCLNIP